MRSSPAPDLHRLAGCPSPSSRPLQARGDRHHRQKARPQWPPARRRYASCPIPRRPSQRAPGETREKLRFHGSIMPPRLLHRFETAAAERVAVARRRGSAAAFQRRTPPDYPASTLPFAPALPRLRWRREGYRDVGELQQNVRHVRLVGKDVQSSARELPLLQSFHEPNWSTIEPRATLMR